MTDVSQKAYKYKSGTTEGLGAILAVRLVVGLPIGMAAGFIGNIVNSIVVPSPVAGDISAFLARVAIIGIFASTGGMVAWFNLFESKRGAVLVWVVAALGGFGGAIAAYYVGDSVIENHDVYILNQRLTQTVILGAALGANALASLLALTASRLGR